MFATLMLRLPPLFLLFAVIVLSLMWGIHQHRSISQVILRATAVTYAFCLLWATLVPDALVPSMMFPGKYSRGVNPVPLTSLTQMVGSQPPAMSLQVIVMNLLLLAPLGLLLPLIFPRMSSWPRVLGVAVLVAVAIEGLQFLVPYLTAIPRYRTVDIDNLLLDVVGAAGGFAAAAVLRAAAARFRSRGREAAAEKSHNPGISTETVPS